MSSGIVIMWYVERKKIRLDKEIYAQGAYLVTICCHEKKKVFSNQQYKNSCVESLRLKALKVPVTVWCYCIMPDHIHVLVQPTAGNLLDFIRAFKNGSSFAIRQAGFNGQVWQRSFHDHALHNDETIETLVNYMVYNPVRAGLVNDWKLWPDTYINPELQF